MAPLNIMLKRSATLEVHVVGLERLTCGSNELTTTIISRPNGMPWSIYSRPNGRQSLGMHLSDLISRGLVQFYQLPEDKMDVEIRIGDSNGKVIGKKSIELKNTETNRIEIQVSDAP